MTFPGKRAAALLLLATSLLAFVSLRGFAYETLDLKLGTLEGPGISIGGAVARLAWLDATHARLQLNAATARIDAVPGKLSGIELLCERAELKADAIACANARIRLRSNVYGRQQLRASFRYSPAGANWALKIRDARLPLQALTAQLAAGGAAVPVLEGDARLAVTASLHGAGAKLHRADLALHLKADEFTNAAGTFAGEKLDLQLDVKARPVTSGWKLALDLTGNSGGVYVEPVYLAMPKQPLRASATLDWQEKTKRLVVHAFNYHHPGSVRLAGSGRVAYDPVFKVEALELDIAEAVFPSLYDTYVQPWLTGTLPGNLKTAGRASGGISFSGDALQRLELDLQELFVEERDGLFGFENLLARIRWSATGAPGQSEVQWAGGNIYRVDLGAARIRVQNGRDYVQLLEATQIPVLDGALQIDSFRLAFGDTEPLNWQVDGFMTPVSMKLLTGALGWPEFSGKLSGVIPNVRYTAGNLEVGGVLLVRVFDGEVTLRRLRLEQPFGVVPRLWVDAQARNIDLEMLTRTFSFGKIEGTIEGHIDGLQMESWRPAAFDASFSTPPGDKSRHRISQKAVDNISSIGGAGVGGALSRSFLRVFKDFPYARLGIRCRLENGTCAMGGVEPAENGYYLVKGRFIPPRLDVIGFADRVNWNSLVSQIISVTRNQELVVQ